MRWTVTQPAAALPVTWPELRAHLRLDDETSRDYVMEQLAAAAVGYAERTMGRSLMRRTLTATFYPGSGGPWPAAYVGGIAGYTTETPQQPDPLYLPMGPVVQLTSVVDGASNAALPATAYRLEYVGNAARLRVNNAHTYPLGELVVTYDAGYDSAKAIPAEIRHAVRMHVSHLWNHPDAFADTQLLAVPAGLEAFYRLHSWESGVG